jgi:hypothetical protein
MKAVFLLAASVALFPPWRISESFHTPFSALKSTSSEACERLPAESPMGFSCFTLFDIDGGRRLRFEIVERSLIVVERPFLSASPAGAIGAHSVISHETFLISPVGVLIAV